MKFNDSLRMIRCLTYNLSRSESSVVPVTVDQSSVKSGTPDAHTSLQTHGRVLSRISTVPTSPQATD